MCCLAHGELAWLFLEPDTVLEHCPRILLSALEQGPLSRSVLSGLASLAPAQSLDRKIADLPRAAVGQPAPLFSHIAFPLSRHCCPPGAPNWARLNLPPRFHFKSLASFIGPSM